MTQHNRSVGVEILSSGYCLPEKVMSNADLEKCMDTSDAWIVKRTGIRERRLADLSKGERTSTLAIGAINNALKEAGLEATDIDLLLIATMTPDAPTPSVACVVAREIGAGNIAAIDINAACSGFIYTISMADMMMSSGPFKTVCVVGADTLTKYVDYTTEGRNSAILFGDAAAALILRKTDDKSKGLIAHRMHTDGSGSKHLYIPATEHDVPAESDYSPGMCDRVQMNGQAVFKFAVSKFQQVIEDTLNDAGLSPNDVDHFVCHQANSRILEAARERFGLPEEKLMTNIHKYGNTVAASAPLVFAELAESGKIKPGQKVMFLAFGAGLTWGSSLWQL
jgi:3-oxoacyl-[acyl-carrier-protein] synthase III